jgi:hypothetical protein
MQKYVMVKTISTFEITYMIPMQEGLRVEDHLDYVTCNEVEEMSQEHVDECILPNSVRVLTEEEALAVFDRENAYFLRWSTQQKLDMIHRSIKEEHKDG